jgi:DNA modification methylase
MEFSPFGNDLFGEPIKRPLGPLAQKFEWPPFSVLSARDGEWQDRKRAWLSLGIQSELGRNVSGENCTSGKHSGMIWAVDKDKKEEWGRNRKSTNGKDFGATAEGCADWQQEKKALVSNTLSSANAMKYAGGFEDTPAGTSITSIFDPVLAELCFRWFCPPGGNIVDPFCGGSVRGIVAGLLGFKYSGIDLRQEQIDANCEQREKICPDAKIIWHCGDSLTRMAYMPECDFIFSCPPYGDLERYSDDPADLSTMEYADFIGVYRRIIERCSTLLRPNRLACFVVGDFRDRKTGMYRGFVADTVKASVTWVCRFITMRFW